MKNEEFKIVFDVLKEIKTVPNRPLPQKIITALTKYFPDHLIYFLTGPSYEMFMQGRDFLSKTLPSMYYFPAYSNSTAPNEHVQEIYRSTLYLTDPGQPVNLPKHLVGKTVVTSKDFTGDNLKKYKDLMGALSESNIHHKAVIYLYEKNICLGLISLMRHKSFGTYSKTELEIFDALSEVLSPIYYQYLESSFYANMANIFRGYCDSQNVGLAIITSDLSLLDCNTYFLTMCSEIISNLYDGKSPSNINTNMISSVVQMLIQSTEPISAQLMRTIVSGGERYQCMLKPVLFTGLSPNIRTVFLLRLQKQKGKPDAISPQHPALARYNLTGRESEIVALLVSGHKTSQIATSLNISPYTAKNHISSIFRKVGVSSRLELFNKLGL